MQLIIVRFFNFFSVKNHFIRRIASFFLLPGWAEISLSIRAFNISVVVPSWRNRLIGFPPSWISDWRRLFQTTHKCWLLNDWLSGIKITDRRLLRFISIFINFNCTNCTFLWSWKRYQLIFWWIWIVNLC